jgi:hypothetical protein
VIRWRRGVVNMQKPGTSSWRWRELRRAADSGSVGDPVRESRAKTCTNRRRSEGWFGNLSSTKFGNHAWRHSRTDGEAKSKLLSQKVRVLSVN